MIDTISKKLIQILIILSIIALSIYLIKQYFNYCLYEYRVAKDEVVDIPKGYSSKKIAELLFKREIINDTRVFVLWTKVKKYTDSGYLIAGEYKINKGMNMLQIIEKMLAGDIVVYKLTIPEGSLTIEAVNIIINSPRVINDLDGKSEFKAQGIIMPETYFYTYGAKASELLEKCAKNLDKFIDHTWNHRDQLINNIITNKQEVMILASIVEREAKLDTEKRRIAAVYFNRLKIKMPLQADPTVIFAITKGKTFDLKLSHNDLRFASPYNTYMTNGLPPSPICNPGKASIEAVMHPHYTNEIYFVADGKGGHLFSSSFKDHGENIKKYRKALLESNPTSQ
ncbi:MAG: endolytic transglycosylase MltG [Candidatus Midichloria sp.]|nr:MAG: endolytic transglycosylase MltG [Candidatus Midichloria sp.]